MKRIFASIIVLAATTAINADDVTLKVSDTRLQTVTGFGAACCDGAMCPFGKDIKPVKLLYGSESEIGLNILRMEISPNFEGDIVVEEWGNWDSPYDWNGSLPSAKEAKKRGAIVFGTPWSPPGEYKTNGSAQGGNSDDQGNQKGKLRKDCYKVFFPWLNMFLEWMQENGVDVDAVSIQNEPDWWVSYSGCLYTPEEQLELVKNYAYMLDREKYKGVRLISAEPLGFDPSYFNALVKDEEALNQIDIFAGHIYGHAPLGNMKTVATKAAKYGKEVWMTEHSVSDNIQNRLPNWSEQLEFARELNECMLAGGTGYVYWYMRAHWAFVGTGEEEYGTDNKKNKLLPRAYVMSHFAKNVTGSTRLDSKSNVTVKTNADVETSAFIKGDSLIIMGINSTKTDKNLNIELPFKVKSGINLQSTGNETENLCQRLPITINEPVSEMTVSMPAQSLNTYIFMLDEGSAAINEVKLSDYDGVKTYYDLQGRRMENPHGICVEKSANGGSRIVIMGR